MNVDRRKVVGAALALPAMMSLGWGERAAAEQLLKVSHQFPGGTIDSGDFRDRMCRVFAAQLRQRTNGALGAEVYASYKQGAAWKNSTLGRKFAQFLESKGVLIIAWVWQAGGVASRNLPIVSPEDAKGLKIRGGSREMDMVLKAAGAATLSIPSNEAYAAMQTGACDAVITSSTSLISFRLEEVSKALTTGRGKSYWFMLEPLIMSRQVFAALTKSQQDMIMALGQELENFGTTEAMADDQKVADVYGKKGAVVRDLDDAIVDKWRAIARETAWKDYASRSALAAEMLELAEKIPVG